MEIPCDDSDRSLFAAATRITLGDGLTAKFWYSSWLDGAAPKNLAPKIFEISKHKHQTVASALQTGRWVQDIDLTRGLSTHHIHQFVGLWSKTNQIHLTQGIQDEILWKQTTNGIYSSRFAYSLHFLGSFETNFKALIWKIGRAHV